eukprot:UN0727
MQAPMAMTRPTQVQVLEHDSDHERVAPAVPVTCDALIPEALDGGPFAPGALPEDLPADHAPDADKLDNVAEVPLADHLSHIEADTTLLAELVPETPHEALLVLVEHLSLGGVEAPEQGVDKVVGSRTPPVEHAAIHPPVPVPPEVGVLSDSQGP